MREEKRFKTPWLCGVLADYVRILEAEGYAGRVAYIGLYGSQNYNADDEKSDVDARAIVIPTLREALARKDVSRVIETPTGAVDVKDLWTYYQVLRKGNPAFLEPAKSVWWHGDERLRGILGMAKPNLKAMFGMMHEKRHALTHPFPSKADEFEKWGFDPKQLHHILRLEDVLTKDIKAHAGLTYWTYPKDSPRLKELMDVKRNVAGMSAEEAVKAADDSIARVKAIFPADYVYAPLDATEEILGYLEGSMRKYVKAEKAEEGE